MSREHAETARGQESTEHTARTSRDQPRRTSGEERSPDEIQQDIRRTRAEMSDTVNELEHRLSPERLKHEAKGAVHETMDEVRDRYHPQRIVNRAKRSMIDTVREHPIATLTAGLSLGYLMMRSGDSGSRERDYSHDYDRGYEYRRRSYAPESGPYYDPTHHRREDYDYPEYQRARAGARQEYGRGGERSVQDRASETAEEVKERAGEAAEQVQETAREAGHRVREGAQEAGYRVRRGARRAENQVEDFVSHNPLAAGAVALGIGALLGGMFPSTRTEDEWMGPARDEAARRAQEAASETMEQARESAERVGERTDEAATRVQRTARQEARGVKETAQKEAKNVGEEAGQQAKEKATE